MAILQLKLEQQLLTIQNKEIIASGDVNVDFCQFVFDDIWNELVKTAVFYQDRESVYYVFLDKYNKCVIPAEAMQKSGKMYIGVFGVKGADILTSTVEQIELREGAIDGIKIATEPTDDIFLAIVAQYQKMAELMEQYHHKAEEINLKYQEQIELLKSLNAYDVIEIEKRVSIAESKVLEYKVIANEILEREVILRNYPIIFQQGICEISNPYITELSICDVYFDEFSFELASNSFIAVTSHDGYLRLTSAKQIDEPLNANIIIRRY